MTNFLDALSQFWTSFVGVIKSFSFPVDIIDILVVALIVYHAIRLVLETRAMQLVKGIAAILLIYFFASQLQMITLGFFIQNILQLGIFILVVLFQPEIRSALEKVGRSNLGGIMRFGGSQGEANEIRRIEDLIAILVESCGQLAATKTGALIVIERQTKLGDVISTGTLIDAQPSAELIGNLFFNKSPLHDGAMIVRDCRLYAAGCYLPLSKNQSIARDLGTRHRAALGMSEVSDAVTIVVSEETGSISITNESRLQRGLSEKNLRKLLQIKLLDPIKAEKSAKKAGFWKGKK